MWPIATSSSLLPTHPKRTQALGYLVYRKCLALSLFSLSCSWKLGAAHKNGGAPFQNGRGLFELQKNFSNTSEFFRLIFKKKYPTTLLCKLFLDREGLGLILFFQHWKYSRAITLPLTTFLEILFMEIYFGCPTFRPSHSGPCHSGPLFLGLKAAQNRAWIVQ